MCQASKATKVPVIAFSEDEALGNAFYLLVTSGNLVYANPYSILGDIDHSVQSLGVSKLLENIYIKRERITHMDSISPSMSIFHKISKKDADWWNDYINTKIERISEDIFEKRKVTFARKKIELEDVRKFVKSGKVISAKQAYQLGYVDGIKTFEQWYWQQKSESQKNSLRLQEHFIDRTTQYSGPVVLKKMFNKWNEFNALDSVIQSQGVEAGVSSFLNSFQTPEAQTAFSEFLSRRETVKEICHILNQKINQ